MKKNSYAIMNQIRKVGWEKKFKHFYNQIVNVKSTLSNRLKGGVCMGKKYIPTKKGQMKLPDGISTMKL
jgi:hypothetical protein